jgi:hypothetical protein
MTQPIDYNATWRLHFDRDGTDDVAIICDANGVDLATSPQFWLPTGNDPIPPTLAALWLMTAAPELLEALAYLLEQTVDMDLKHGIELSEREAEARAKALTALAKARKAA